MTVGLPARPFLYTPDQIAHIIAVRQATVEDRYLYYEGRSIGIKHSHQMTARNIARPGDTPVWRVSEQELIRWMRIKGFRLYERTGFYSDPAPTPEKAEPDSPEDAVDTPDEGG